jgi:hypothetical protein
MRSMSNDDGNGVSPAFHASAYRISEDSTPEQLLRALLADATELQVDPFVRAICSQLFDHSNPEVLTGWQAELLVEATSEIIYSARAQQGGLS